MQGIDRQAHRGVLYNAAGIALKLDGRWQAERWMMVG